ncbi:MAG: YraN family protein, partial [Candidatus Omnitrophica bacterium]|nr:YraN family protein [Candidatus Omnitrophota bacterium]
CEIDLIVRDKKTLIFVEVKTKAGEEFGSPEEAITTRKIKRLCRGALAYAISKGYLGAYRLDAVCIVLDQAGDPQRIKHYKNITI